MRLRSGGIRRSVAAIALAGVTTTLGSGLALAQTATPTPTPAAPPAQLTITTTYPSIAVDPGGTATLPLQVTSPVVERVDLAVNGAPEGFGTTFRGGGLIVSSVTTTGTGTSPALNLEVDVPEDATPSTVRFQVQATAPSGQATIEVDLVIAEEAGGSVTLSSTNGVEVQSGSSTQTFTFTLALENDTSQAQTFSFEGEAVAPDGQVAPNWEVTVTPSGQAQAASVIVDAGDSQNLTVTVRPAPDAPAGDYPILVSATSGDQTAQKPLGIRITGSYSFTMTSATGRLNTTANAGQATTYQVVITNTGTADLQNVTLTAAPPTGWDVQWDTPTIASVPVDGSATATATLTPASNAISGDYIVTLTARADQVTASQTIQLRTTVETSSIWGFVGIAIIVVVLIGLFVVFQRYGRR